MQPRSSKEYMELIPSKRHAQMRNEVTSIEQLSSVEIGESPQSPKRSFPKGMDQLRHSGGRGSGSDRFPSQMIPQVRKRPRDNDENGCNVCGFCEPGEISHAHANSGFRHVHGRREREIITDRRTQYPHEYGRSDGKMVAVEEGELPTPYYEICASGPSLKQGASRCSEHLNNMPLRVQSYKGRESRLLPRDTVAVHPRSHLRGFPDYAHRGIRRASTINSRGPILDSYEDDESLPPAYEYLHDGRSSKSVPASAYRKKVPVNSARNPSVGQNNSSYYSHFQQSGYHSHEDEFEEYPYIEQNIVDDSSGYPSNNFHEYMAPHPRRRYKHSEDEDYHVDMSRPCKRRSALDRLEIAEGRGDSSKSSVGKHTSMQKHSARSSLHSLDNSQQGEKYPMHGYGPADYERRQPQNLKAAHLGSKMEYRPYANSKNAFEREVDFCACKERYGSAGMHQFNRKTPGVAARRQIMGKEEIEEEEVDGHMYISSERLHREKHCLGEHLHEEAYHRTITRKPSTFEYEDLDGSEDFNDEEDEGGICFANSPNDEPEMGEVTYREQIRKQDFLQDPLFFQDNLKHEEMHSRSFSRYQGNTLKGHHKSGSLRWYSNAHHNIARKSGFHRNQTAEVRNHGAYYEDEIANEYDPSKDPRNHEEPALDEESDEFQQLVQEYFLKYSKMININSAVQRRYQSQGKAGPLFCIACGRRFSKEFLDTDRLVKHTFMAKRHWLRAKHLGLHRAICVSLGWSSLMSVDTPTAPPLVLPHAEAFAKKADLIIWPPVFIIHNLSMVIESPEDQKVVSVERVEAFLRGKGFADGKMVICLGNPVDQSVMVVKFLGTFTGLRNAMKLQEYFAENHHGRVEFVNTVSHPTERKNSESAARSVGEDSELEELNLYGYLGIAEDLDRVDFKTRQFCMIKSNKEIDDFENAPIKAE